MASTNIFDTRHIIKQTPKMGNRFLLTADSTRLNDIVNGKSDGSQEIPKFRQLNTFTGGNDEIVYSKNPTQVLNLSLLSCTIPAFEFETGDVNRYNDTVKHITKFTAVNDMNTVFYDYINGSATSVMLAWQSAVGFKLTGEINYKKKYVCDLDLYIYGPNRPGYQMAGAAGATDFPDSAEKESIMQFKIFNAWPRSVDIGDFSYDNAEIKKVTIQFGYDMIVPIKNNTRSSRGHVTANEDFNNALGVTNKEKLTSDKDIGDSNDTIYTVYINNKTEKGIA